MSATNILPSSSITTLYETIKGSSFVNLLQNNPLARITFLAGSVLGLLSSIYIGSRLLANKPTKDDPWKVRENNPFLLNESDSSLQGITKMAIFLLTGGLAIYGEEILFRLKELSRLSKEDRAALYWEQTSAFQLLWEKVKNLAISFLLFPKSILDSLSQGYSWSLRYGSILFLKSEDSFVAKVAKLALIVFTAGTIFPLVECLGRLIELFILTPEEQKRVDSGEVTALRVHWEKVRDVVLGFSMLIPELLLCGYLDKKMEKFHTAPQEIDTIFHRFDQKSSLAKFLWQGTLFSHIVFFGPLLEEWLFRDYFYSWIEKRQAHEEVSWKTLWQVKKIPPNAWHQRISRIFITAICFGIAHVSAAQGWANIPILAITTLAGLILALLREITQKTTASETLHCAHNFTVTAAQILS